MREGCYNLMSWKSWGCFPMRMPKCVKKDQRDGMIVIYNLASLKKVRRFCCLIQGWSYFLGSLNPDGKDPIPSTEFILMELLNYLNNYGGTFKVNGQRLKHYWDGEVERVESSFKLTDP